MNTVLKRSALEKSLKIFPVGDTISKVETTKSTARGYCEYSEGHHGSKEGITPT